MLSHNLAIAVFAGLGGMVGWGFADFFAKKTIDAIGDLQTLFWSQLIGVAPILALFVAQRNIPPLHGLDGVYLVLFGAVSALSYLPLYTGFGKGQVSLLSPIFASYAAVVVLLSVVLFGEEIGSLQWLAIAIVFAGVLLISTDLRALRSLLVRGKAARSAGVKEVVSALLVYSVWLVLFDQFLGHPRLGLVRARH